MNFTQDNLFKSLLIFIVIALIISGISPFDRVTWFLEIAPVLIALPILVATRKSFPLTPMLYILITLHCIVLIIGSIWTYAHVPLGFWIQDFFSLSRNPYDKIGHFMQGFVPVLLTREILIRGTYVKGRKMLAFLSLCVILAFSAVYELIEWWAALILGQGADEFLGMQGYQWDTQSDMFFAIIGGSVALLLLSGLHNRQLKKYNYLPETA